MGSCRPAQVTAAQFAAAQVTAAQVTAAQLTAAQLTATQLTAAEVVAAGCTAADLRISTGEKCCAGRGIEGSRRPKVAMTTMTVAGRTRVAPMGGRNNLFAPRGQSGIHSDLPEAAKHPAITRRGASLRLAPCFKAPVRASLAILQPFNRYRSDIVNAAALRRCWIGIAGLLIACCQACGGPPPPVVVKPLPSPVLAHKAETLDPALVAQALGDSGNRAYQIGPGDTVLVAVYRHPELAITYYTGSTSNTAGARLSGLVVDNDGTIQFPLIGSVQVAGKTADQLRVYLEQELAAFIKEPNVTVQVVFAGSIRYYLLGQFTAPGLKFSDRPLHLLEALSLGGSVDFEHASLRSAYVARAGRRLPVNFQKLIREGDLKQNIVLEPGDVILIPDNLNEQAFVFGGAPGSNPRGGPVQFVQGRLSLLQALAQVGFGRREHFQGRLADTVVIRSESDRGEMFVVDAERILEGEAASFELAPGDVVYVPSTAITDFNQALEQILPSLQTISGLLTPFVQIKFLSE